MSDLLPRRVIVLLAGMVLLALFGPVIAPGDPAEVLDPVAGRLLPPLSTAAVVHQNDGRRYLGEVLDRSGETLRLRRLGREMTIDASAVERVERVRFWLGTDKFGRDLLSRILYGARISLVLGLAASLFALVVGILVGSAAALGGPLVDGLLMRSTDAFLAFPRIFLLLAAGALLRPDTWLLVGFLAATGWMGAARLARAEILSLREREFILAARVSGLSPWRIWLRHLLPNAATPLVVEGTLRVGDLILAEAALSFLGFGVQPPIPSWGNMIADAGTTLPQGMWAAFWPGLALVLTVAALNLVADDLREHLDPRSATPHLVT